LSKNITIVGGGLVGLISAALLANNKFFVNIIEANPQNFKLEDAKALALSNSSVFILKKLRIWEDLLKNTIPIKEIHVSQKNSFGRTLFKSEDYEEDALGYIVSYSSMMNLLRNKIEKLCNTQIISNAKAESIQESDGEKQVVIKREKSYENIPFNLLVLADGGKSSIKGIELIREEKKFRTYCTCSINTSK
jgi:2-octaprenyl-6-methoxyphenol hydroxylase